MPQEIIDAIDEFIDAKSSIEIPDDAALRKKLYQALVNKVTEDWGNYLVYYQKKLSEFEDDYARGVFYSHANKLQESCATLVSELEECERSGHTKEALFRSKEMALILRREVSEFMANQCGNN